MVTPNIPKARLREIERLARRGWTLTMIRRQISIASRHTTAYRESLSPEVREILEENRRIKQRTQTPKEPDVTVASYVELNMPVPSIDSGIRTSYCRQ